jgi:hypothetical protein
MACGRLVGCATFSAWGAGDAPPDHGGVGHGRCHPWGLVNLSTESDQVHSRGRGVILFLPIGGLLGHRIAGKRARPLIIHVR